MVIDQTIPWYRRTLRWGQTNLNELDPTRYDSEWWRQYKPGDTYTFELRRGGLGIWQVNMTKIYDAQKRYYRCGGVLSCMTK